MYQCGFQKGLSVKHSLLVMSEKNGKKYLDRNGVSGALLSDLSKTFDYLPHLFFIAKLHAYGSEETFESSETKDRNTQDV